MTIPYNKLEAVCLISLPEWHLQVRINVFVLYALLHILNNIILLTVSSSIPFQFIPSEFVMLCRYLSWTWMRHKWTVFCMVNIISVLMYRIACKFQLFLVVLLESLWNLIELTTSKHCKCACYLLVTCYLTLMGSHRILFYLCTCSSWIYTLNLSVVSGIVATVSALSPVNMNGHKLNNLTFSNCNDIQIVIHKFWITFCHKYPVLSWRRPVQSDRKLVAVGFFPKPPGLWYAPAMESWECVGDTTGQKQYLP